MKFECKKCGFCCRELREGGGGNLPLWEWEVDALEEIAKKKGISLKIQPQNVALDKKSGLTFCTLYNLVQEPCPFLENNQCSIYEDRPLICRCFPLCKSSLLGGDINLSSFGICPNLDAKKVMRELGASPDGSPTKFDKKDVIKKYKETFGEEIFISAFQEDNIQRCMEWTMKKLIDNKKIKFRKINKFDYSKYTPYPIFEFFVKTNLMSEDKKEKTINSLIDVERAKDIINSVEKELE